MITWNCPFLQRSYLFQNRPLTPPRYLKQDEYSKELGGQVSHCPTAFCIACNLNSPYIDTKISSANIRTAFVQVILPFCWSIVIWILSRYLRNTRSFLNWKKNRNFLKDWSRFSWQKSKLTRGNRKLESPNLISLKTTKFKFRHFRNARLVANTSTIP